MTEERATSEPNLADEILGFVQGIDALATSLPLVMVMLEASGKVTHKDYSAFLAKYGEPIEQDERTARYRLAPEYQAKASALKRDHDNAKIAYAMIPRSFIVSLVSQFDAFLGRLLRAMFLLRPELLSSSERQISLSQLLELGTVPAATEYILEKEVETVLRKSHAEQFDWMENRFKLTLRKDLAIWSEFVELTERRNLFVHTGGIVSSQYIAVCKEHNVKFDAGMSTGTQLGAGVSYFDAAYRVVYEIGVKLAHVLWRKLRPDQLETSDRALGNLAFDLVVAGRYDLAIVLLEFSCLVLKKHAKEKFRRIDVVNLAQAYKWNGQPEKCVQLLENEDWSASGRDLELAVAVLTDDFERAASVMKQIGPDGEVPEQAYKDWPMFKEFRNTELFGSTFEAVFGRPYVVVEESLPPDEGHEDNSLLAQESAG